MSSPTSRSLKLLRDEGYTAQVVERWNAYAKVRQDLFGCIDIVAVREGEILGVQACADTGGSGIAGHLSKSLAIPHLKVWLQAGGKFVVMGWAKKGPRGKVKHWKVRKVRIVLNLDGEPVVEVWNE